MVIRFALLIFVAGLGVSSAAAQIRAGSGTAGFGIAVGSGRAGASTGMHPGHSLGGASILLAYPDFYSDSEYVVQSPQPQVIVVPSSAPPAPLPPPAPRESLLIEWQGDHFVRTTTSAKASENQSAPDYSERPVVPITSSSAAGRQGQRVVAPAPHQLPPAVLVFHDGHREEITEYSIMSGTIYSNADYWTTGSWTRKIQIADLDVPSTMRANQARGLKFVLPVGPNEVVVRP